MFDVSEAVPPLYLLSILCKFSFIYSSTKTFFPSDATDRTRQRFQYMSMLIYNTEEYSRKSIQSIQSALLKTHSKIAVNMAAGIQWPLKSYRCFKSVCQTRGL